MKIEKKWMRVFFEKDKRVSYHKADGNIDSGLECLSENTEKENSFTPPKK